MHIGFLFNCSIKTNPMARLSPTVINRVMLIDAVLKQHGSRVFYYSPKHIKSINEPVPGYLIENNQFVPSSSAIPLINGNWTYSMRRLLDKGMGYRTFMEWAEANQIGIYVPLSFSELVANKLDAYKLVRGYSPGLHPHTEPYRQALPQLKVFLEQGHLVFLKPRAGNKGDGIVSLRRAADGMVIKFYKDGAQRVIAVQKLAEAVELIKRLTEDSKRYVIQNGIDAMRHEGSVFDIRVVMLYDGQNWSWLHEVRYSPADSDLSNVSQGGISLSTEELLVSALGREGASRVLESLRSEAFGLARYLDQLHPRDLMEIAFDFVLAKDASLHLVEINTKPGLVSVGFLNRFFEMQPGQQPLFERWVYPHTESLANFLLAKSAALQK